jgi:hypothetical protein
MLQSYPVALPGFAAPAPGFLAFVIAVIVARGGRAALDARHRPRAR